MPIRITGMNSGLDTDKIVSELVKGQRAKVDNIKKNQTSLQWKQDAWKELNTKALKLFNGTLSKMRFSDAYSKKVTKVSNSSAVSVVTGENTVTGVQTLKVTHLAKAGYLTGAKLDGTVTNNTTLSQLTQGAIGDGDALSFSFEIGGNTTVIDDLTGSSKVSDVVSRLRNAGLNASFDVNNQRFFISSKTTGADADFTLTANDPNADTVLSAMGVDVAPGRATKIDGQDAEIELNGAVFTSKSNTFDINGLVITAIQETGSEIVTLITQDDTDGIYGMIKDFFREYNALINEMDKLYNAPSAKDYKPLTDEEKEALTESEITKWEQKIKDSILRRDSSLFSISDAMKNAMSKAVPVNGGNMYLSSFGIETLSYFLSPENEKNAYHINGDEDDTYTSNADDRLKSMIASDPSTVTSFFTGLAKNLYAQMNSIIMTRNNDTSINMLYDDKKMKRDYDDYTKKIAEQEAKVIAIEDKYYRQFTAMEKALAKLQSSQNALSGLLGNV